MRRILLSAVALCLLAGVAPPGAATPSGHVGAVQIAWADWIDMNGRTGVYYGAIGIRGADTMFGPESVGVVFKGRCRRYRDGNGVIIMCGAGGVGHTVGPQEFWVDPLLRSASLDITADGFDHSVDWSGRRGDESGRASTNDQRTIVYNEAWRNAKIAGNLYGRPIPKGRAFWKMGFLYELAELQVRHDLERLGIDVGDDGTIRIERAFRVPS